MGVGNIGVTKKPKKPSYFATARTPFCRAAVRMFHLDREEYLDNAEAGQLTIPAYRCHACVRRIAGRAARDYRSPLRTLVRTRHVPRTACPQRPQDHSVCRSAAARASVLAGATAVWCSSV